MLVGSKEEEVLINLVGSIVTSLAVVVVVRDVDVSQKVLLFVGAKKLLSPTVKQLFSDNGGLLATEVCRPKYVAAAELVAASADVSEEKTAGWLSDGGDREEHSSEVDLANVSSFLAS